MPKARGLARKPTDADRPARPMASKAHAAADVVEVDVAAAVAEAEALVFSTPADRMALAPTAQAVAAARRPNRPQRPPPIRLRQPKRQPSNRPRSTPLRRYVVIKSPVCARFRG